MTPDLQTLGQQYINYAVSEIPVGRDRPRSPTTISSFRRAVEGFVAAAQGRNPADLPPDFIEHDWMQTQQSVLTQPIQLRVRVGAVRKFAQWLQQHGLAVPQFTFPNITTPPPKKKEPMMNDVTQLADPMLNESTVPSTQPQQFQPAMQTAVPPPPPAPRAPAKPQRPQSQNPLASMFPAGSWKLRVRREREGADDPVFIGDFPQERVQAYGAIEPFLSREVAPKVVAQGITGDITFAVTAVDTNGAESNRARLTIACVPVGSQPSPVAAPVAVPVAQPSSRDELLDVLTTQRRAQEEVVERIGEKLSERAGSSSSAEMEEMRRTMSAMAGAVQTLAAKLEDLQRPAQQPVVAQPQPDMLGMMRLLLERAVTPPVQPQPVQQQSSVMEVFNMMAQAKQMFAPAQVNIDVSPLEEQIHDLRKQLAETKKDDVTEMVTKFKGLKELFSLVDPTAGAPKSTTLSSALGSLVQKVVDNPQPLAEAVERVLGAMTPLRSAPSAEGSQPQKPTTPTLPPQLLDASRALLAASGDTITVAAHHWLTLLQQVPATQKVAARIIALLNARKSDELTIVLRQVFTHLGFMEQATPDAVRRISTGIFAKLKQLDEEKAAAEEESEDEESDEEGEEEDDEGEEDAADDEQGQPDLTVRVGGQAQESDEESEEASDDESDEGGEEESDDDDAEPSDEEAPAEEPEAVEPTPEELEAAQQPEPEFPVEGKRKRRSKKEKAELPPPEPPRLGLRELSKNGAA